MIPDAELNVDNLKVSQLKVECRARDIKATGRKAELKQRLLEYIEQHKDDEKNKEPEDTAAEPEDAVKESGEPEEQADDEKQGEEAAADKDDGSSDSSSSSSPAPPPAPEADQPQDEPMEEANDEENLEEETNKMDEDASKDGPAVQDLTQNPVDLVDKDKVVKDGETEDQEKQTDPGEMTRTFGERPLGFSVSQDKQGRAFASFHDNAAQFVIWKINNSSVDGVEFMHVIELLKSEPLPMKITFKKMGVIQGGSKRFVPNSEQSVTNSVRIDGFKRPLRTTKVTDELKSFGTVERFWINAIKTHCYVTFSSEEEAVACREGLHNVYFPRDIDPVFAGRLKVEYVTTKKVTNAIEAAENKTLSNKDRQRLARKKRRRDEEESEERGRKERGKDGEKEKKKKKKKKRRTADSLFKKSKAKPHIYFMPLTDDQVKRRDTAQKLAKRLTEARERRNRDRERRGGGRDRGRDSYRRRSRSRGRRRR